MFCRESSRVEEITVKRAESLIKLNTFEAQRPPSKDHISFLVQQMVAGMFRRGEISIAKFQDKEILVNGQHQLRAIIEFEKTVPATVDVFRCDTNSDLWHLFATFDSHKSRTQHDVIRAARPLFSSEALKQMELRVLNLCSSAIAFLAAGEFLNGESIPNFTGIGKYISKNGGKAGKVALLEKHVDDAIFVNRLFTTDSKYLFTNASVTAMISSRRANRTRAEEFWTAVMSGENLIKGTPQFALHKSLNEASRKRLTSGGQDAVQSLYILCIVWWNSYISEEKRNAVKVASIKKIPGTLG